PEFIKPFFRNRKCSIPLVIVGGGKRHRGPFPGARLSVKHFAAEVVMAVSKDMGADGDAFADRALDGIKTAVDLRLHIFNNYPGLSVFHYGCISLCEKSKSNRPVPAPRHPTAQLLPRWSTQRH